MKNNPDLKRKEGCINSFDRVDILNKDRMALEKMKEMEKKFEKDKKLKKTKINKCIITSSIKDDSGLVDYIKINN